MSKAPRIEGFYFTLAVRLFNNDWSPAKRAVAIGLCRLCAETNGSGVIKLHVSDLIDAITSFTFDGKPPRKSAVLKEIDSLSSGAFLQKLSGNYVFVREFWGLNHAPGNDNHWNPIVRSVDSMPLEARSAWHAYYDPIRDAALDAIANRKRKGIKDAIADQQDQEQDHKQEQEHIEPPLPPTGGNGAVAPAGRAGRTAKPESPDDLQAARQIEAYIAAKAQQHGTKTGRLDNSNYPATAAVIRKLREIDGVSLEEVRKTLDYAWGKTLPGGSLYGEVLLSIARWRTDEKFLKAYRQAMNQRDTSASDYTRTSYTPAGPPVDFDNPSIVWDRPSKAVRGE